MAIRVPMGDCMTHYNVVTTSALEEGPFLEVFSIFGSFAEFYIIKYVALDRREKRKYEHFNILGSF